MTELPEPGEVFAEKYVIESRLGQGAAGVVFSATHQELRQRVALKVLRITGSVAGERMIREARASITLQSEHVVRVMDVGRHRGSVFLVMEQLEGADLGSLLRARGHFPVAEAVDYVLQACAGVAEAHARGFVHRDLKPSNLFVARRADGSPLVKVLDFGISKSSDDADAEVSLTGPAESLGTPLYMSPEQVRVARNVDHRTDIWALGVILFRLLTGKAPFGGGMGASAALAAVVSDEPASLRELLPDVPPELERIVQSCLVKAPEGRLGSVADLAARLAPFGTEDGRASVVRLIRSRSHVLEPAAPPARATRRRLVLVLACVAAAAISAVVFAFVEWRAPAAPAPASAPASVASSEAVVPAASASTIPAEPPPAAPATTTRPGASVTVSPTRPQTGRPVRRPRAPTSSSVVRSAATDDRY
jgi:eukaryotic-like serine/threonine-protein kinase